MLNLSAVFDLIVQGNYGDVVYYFDYSIGFGSFSDLLVLAPAIGGGLILWEEMINKAYYQMLVRTSRTRFIISHIVACIIVSASCMVIVLLSVLGTLSLFLPFIEQNPERLIDLQQDFHGYLWQGGSCIPFVLFYCFLAAMNGILWGSFTLMVSTYTNNVFVILMCPIIASQASNIFLALIDAPNAIKPYHLLSGYFVLGDTLLQEIPIVILIYAAYLFPCIGHSASRIRRRIYDD